MLFLSGQRHHCTDPTGKEAGAGAQPGTFWRPWSVAEGPPEGAAPTIFPSSAGSQVPVVQLPYDGRAKDLIFLLDLHDLFRESLSP